MSKRSQPSQASDVEKSGEYKKIRLRYKDIRENLEKGRMEQRGLPIVLEMIPEVEDAYRAVERSNEAVIDAVVVAEMSDITAKETKKFEMNSAKSFDLDNYVKCLSDYMDASSTSATLQDIPSTFATELQSDVSGLAALGRIMYNTSLRPPLIDHLVGPFSAQRKARKATQRVRRVIDESDKSGPTKISLNQVVHGKKATKLIFELFSLLVQLKATENEPIGLFEFVLNPQSFSQSVENLFYTSFLVKDGKLGLDVDRDNIPIIYPVPSLPADKEARIKEQARRAKLRTRQMIFNLDYQSWKDLCEAFELTEPLIPHRDPEQSREVDNSNPQWYS